ncbi:MAG: TonB-dependent receptor, partial [Planctomycetes bacterium]|nr:TonB-dependent receptor [Planctomycetota bacterium]
MKTWKDKSVGRSALLILGIGLVLAPMTPAVAQQPAPMPSEMNLDPGSTATTNILDMDLDQLAATDVVVSALDVEVTSVSKQESTVGRSPAAIFVITQEMIRRSGVTSVPEALRMAPGLEVARISSHSWAITARGFNNDRYANKLLVLIDGRTVYTPQFSGVYWDVQDLLLEDVERIEVIRGPGGTLWGANAVNGVINILTKKAKDTQGLLVTAGGGTEDSAITGIRYGGKVGDGLNWRVYGKFFERDGSFPVAGNYPANSGMDSAHDDWRVGRGGFRLDWELDPCRRDVITVQGDYYGGTESKIRQITTRDPPDYTEFLNQRIDLAGANVLTRWTHAVNKESDLALQFYYDRTFRDTGISQSEINTLDIDFQHRFPLARRHRVIWGAEYRQVHDDLVPFAFGIDFVPHERTTQVFSMFVQDEITLVDERLFLTVGSKFENNTYSDFEYQPSARVLYTPTPRQAAWAAASRAVRTPARFDHDGQVVLFRMPFPPPPHYWMIQG